MLLQRTDDRADKELLEFLQDCGKISIARARRRELQQLRCALTANAKGAGRRLDFNVTLVLGAGTESECAARALDNDGAGAFVWIIDELVESDR